MHKTIQNLLNIENKIQANLDNLNIINHPKIIAVSKTFKMDKILPLIKHGHVDYGENKVQEAVEKWTEVKANNSNIKLHLIGKLQSNKVKFAVKLFDFIHSVDSVKLAQKIADEGLKINKKIKIFIQVNIGGESQKSGIHIDELESLVRFCKTINLDLMGLMCIPPVSDEPLKYFKEMSKLNKHYGFSDLSMGMSSDYKEAIKFESTFVRIGSKIFGNRN